ncbi:MAG: TrkA family potassium uptake protein [Chloroflexi bacterium]|nr:TrkA family potassium uptake protein [Chloroflexota bacterium]
MYILIVNEQPLGRSLAASLVGRGHEVAYVDEDSEFCNMVISELGCLVIQGENTNIRVLQEAGIERADIVVTLLEKDIKNIMVGLFAKQFSVPRILAQLRQQHYRAAYELVGIDEIVSAFDYLLNEFLMGIEEPNVRHVMSLGNGQIEIAAINVPENSPLLGQNLSALWEHRSFPKGALILGLLKTQTQSFLLPREQPTLAAEDEVLAFGNAEDIHQISLILANKRQRFFKETRLRLP